MRRTLLFLTLFTFIFASACKKSFVRKDVLVMLLDKTINTLNPYESKSPYEKMISSLICFQLFYYDIKTKRLRSGFVENHEVKNNGRKWIFKLKKERYFRSGALVSSKLIKYNIENYLLKGSLAHIFSNIKRVVAKGQYEFVIHLKKSDYEFDALLASSKGFGIVDPTSGDIISGYGPYRLVSFKKGIAVLKRNSAFKEWVVETDKIIFKSVLSEKKRYSALLANKADVVVLKSIQNLLEVDANSFLRKSQSSFGDYLYMKVNRKKINKPLRDSVAGYFMARNYFAKTVFFGYAKPAVSILPEYSMYNLNAEYILFYNPEKVMRLSENSGEKKLKVLINTGDENIKKALDLWVKLLKANNITASVAFKKGNRGRIETDNVYDIIFDVRRNYMIHPAELMFHPVFTKALTFKAKMYILKGLGEKNKQRRRDYFLRAAVELARNSDTVSVLELPFYFVASKNVYGLARAGRGRFDKVRVYVK
jgi:ABC-type transport system substrate-binding protein